MSQMFNKKDDGFKNNPENSFTTKTDDIFNQVFQFI